MNYKNELRLNLRYLVAGGGNAVVGLGLIGVLTLLKFDPIPANAIGFSAGIIFSFFVSRIFVFKSTDKVGKDLLRYMISIVVSYSANISVLYVCVVQLSVDALMSQAIAIFIYVVSMYLFSRFYVFRGEE